MRIGRVWKTYYVSWSSVFHWSWFDCCLSSWWFMVSDFTLMWVCFVLVLDIAICYLSVDWQSSHMLCCLPFVLLWLSGVGCFLGLPCVETGLCCLLRWAVEFCIFCCWIEATLVSTLWCNAVWFCRNKENVAGPSSGCVHWCVMFWGLSLSFSWNVPPCLLSMVHKVLL